MYQVHHISYIDSAAIDDPDDSRPYKDNVTRRRQKKDDNEPVRSGVKADKFDGSSSWVDFRSHFEICAALNKWSISDMGMHLAVSLRGQAQGVLGNLPEGEKCNYRRLKRGSPRQIRQNSIDLNCVRDDRKPQIHCLN